jgi:outer membrane protein assembly factor BamA
MLISTGIPTTAGVTSHSFPLESVKIEGTQLSKEVILEMASLQLGRPVNQAAIEEGCKRLLASGLFPSIAFHYAPGPRLGYVLTLSLADHTSLSEASIEIPGVDENEIWQWLTSRYPRFQRKVPSTGTAQQFLARQIEQHLGAKLEGQHLVVRLEADMVRQMIVSFQPETLPTIDAINFTGQQEFSASELARIIEKLVLNEGYTDRRFRTYLEFNIRRVYEEHGMYRVQFPSIVARKTGAGTVAVTTVIEEGPKYTLGDVRFIGDNLPSSAMLRAANFKTGRVANWTDIQQGIWEAERLLRRAGYSEVAAIPERVFHDEQRILDVKISFRKKSARTIATTGTSPDFEARAQ